MGISLFSPDTLKKWDRHIVRYGLGIPNIVISTDVPEDQVVVVGTSTGTFV